MSGEIEATVRGHLAADAVVKTTPSGKPVAELRLASGVRRPDPKAEGEWIDVRTDWLDVSVWGYGVEAVASLVKGQLIEVRGRLTPGAYLNNHGEPRVDLKLTAEAVLVVPRAPRKDVSDPTPF